MFKMLITLSLFVDYLKDFTQSELKNSERCSCAWTLDRIGYYNEFLKQKVEINMIIPCGKDNVPLEEPVKPPNYDGWLEGTCGAVEVDCLNYKHDAEQYQKAEERVIFKGFALRTIERRNKPDRVDIICRENDSVYLDFERGYFWDIKNGISCGELDTIADFIGIDDLELTDNTIEKIMK